MVQLELAERDHQKRAGAIKNLLSVISRDLLVSTVSRDRNSKIFAASWGHRDNNRYKDWRFETRNSEFPASYAEIWSSIGRGKNFRLEHVYFQIYRDMGRDVPHFPLLAVCSQPYKGNANGVGPHVHVKCAAYPIGKAHIALESMSISDVLTSVDDFDEALKHALKMVDTEILGHPDIERIDLESFVRDDSSD